MRPQALIERVEAAAYRIPTDKPEADGTYSWNSTTLVTVHITGGGIRGFGYTYGSAAIAPLVRDQLAPRVIGLDALCIECAWNALVAEGRNVGRPGIASTARIEQMLFDGFVLPNRGALRPDRLRPGIGVELKQADAEKYAR